VLKEEDFLFLRYAVGRWQGRSDSASSRGYDGLGERR
jgi:hypothetical protein